MWKEEKMAALRRLVSFLESRSVDDDGRCERDAGEVRRMMTMTIEVTHPTFLVALDAARSDAAMFEEDDEEGKRSRRVLEEMEANRVLVMQPRFGPTTMQKARDALERYDEFLKRSAESRETLAARKAREETEIRLDAEIAGRVALDAQKALREIRLVKIPEPKPTLDLLGEDEGKAAATLRAQLKREREEERRHRLDESKRAQRGTEHFASLLLGMTDEALVALACVASAIFEKPDDERRRTLRCENETFKEDFADIFPLYAFGFERVVRANEEFLVQKEPDPVVDLEAWSNWYEQLKAKKNILDRRVSDRNLTSRVAHRREAPPPRWAENRQAH